MNGIEEVRKFLAWQEEQVLAGVADASLERYEEHLARVDMADRLKAIGEIVLRERSYENWDLIARLAS